MSSPENYPSSQLNEYYPVGQLVATPTDVSEMMIYHTSLSDISNEMPNFVLFMELKWQRESNSFVIASSYTNEDCEVGDLLNVFSLRRASDNKSLDEVVAELDMDKMLEALLSSNDSSAMFQSVANALSERDNQPVSLKLPFQRMAVVPQSWANDSHIKDQLSSIYSVALDVITFDFVNEKVISLKYDTVTDFPPHTCDQFDEQAECLTPQEASDIWTAGYNNNNKKG